MGKRKVSPAKGPAVLLDGDVVLMIAASRATFEESWDDLTYSRSLDLREAAREVRSFVASISAKVAELLAPPSEVMVALSCPSRAYWRRDVLPGYKANRKAGTKPPGYSRLEAWMAAGGNGGKEWRSTQVARLEADDVLGILATGKTYAGRDTVVVSTDKDMMGVPGVHLNPRRMEEGLTTVNLDEADRWHLFQTLTGDTTDAYKGCPGVGPVKAEKILAKAERLPEEERAALPVARWHAVVAAFEKAGLDEADALVQARVARILRAGEYDKATGAVKLWAPGP